MGCSPGRTQAMLPPFCHPTQQATLSAFLIVYLSQYQTHGQFTTRRVAHTSRLFVMCAIHGCRTASLPAVSTTVSADRTHAKQRHVCATRDSQAMNVGHRPRITPLKAHGQSYADRGYPAASGRFSRGHHSRQGNVVKVDQQRGRIKAS